MVKPYGENGWLVFTKNPNPKVISSFLRMAEQWAVDVKPQVNGGREGSLTEEPDLEPSIEVNLTHLIMENESSVIHN